MLVHPASVDALVEIPEGVCVLTHMPLDVDQVRKSVLDDGAGATILFVGTTRNSFEGSSITNLSEDILWMAFI
jgi:molybdopterin synthase catalytic subunit